MAATPHSSPDYRVGDWLIQPRLSRIENGETVHVTPRAMAVLVYLVQKQGAVVSRNELLDAIWPRMAVTKDALSQCLVELRKAFGDDSRDPRIIETIPKVGVRLVAQVSRAAPPGEITAETVARQESDRTLRWNPLRIAMVTVAGIVLAGGLLVIADLEPPGTNVSQSGQRSIAAANPEARDLYLSAVNEYYSRPDRREALPYIMDLLERAVDIDPLFALAWARLGFAHTGFYFQGIDRSDTRLELAKQALDKALTLDPELPEGHLFLASYYGIGFSDHEAALAHLAIAEKSLAEDPELRLIRAALNKSRGEWSLALEDSQRALELDSLNPYHLRQHFFHQIYLRDYASADATLDHILMRRPDDATAHADKVFLALVGRGNTELAHRYDDGETSVYRDSSSYTYTRWLAAIFDGEYDKALTVLHDSPGDVLFDVDMQWARSSKTLFYARTHALKGDHALAHASYASAAEEARARLVEPVDENPYALAALHLALAEAQAGLGHHELAREAADKANALVSSVRVRPYGAEWWLTYAIRVLLPLGDDEAALDVLESYLGRHGAWSIEGLQRDPRLANIHDNPRFAALVETYGRD